MALLRRTGFTFVELVVVIAITGVLAALLFPVFARARQSARRSQCLANVKSITAAITMYVTDWDGFWPSERDRRAIDYFNAAPGGGEPHEWPDNCARSYQANPYLRPALILEGYVRSREVWRCPNAHLLNGASMIISPPPSEDWLEEWRKQEGRWGEREQFGPCYTAWPAGWGGSVTDSFAQGRLAIVDERAASAEEGVFLQSIGVNEHLRWQRLSNIGDPAQHVTCGDAGTRADLWSATQLAYPDTCGLGSSGGPGGRLACVGADWQNCAWTRSCGLSANHLRRFYREASYRRQSARHYGGSNIGYLDGHAKWYPSEGILTQSQPFPSAAFEGGLCSCWPGNGVVRRGDNMPAPLREQ